MRESTPQPESLFSQSLSSCRTRYEPKVFHLSNLRAASCEFRIVISAVPLVLKQATARKQRHEELSSIWITNLTSFGLRKWIIRATQTICLEIKKSEQSARVAQLFNLFVSLFMINTNQMTKVCSQWVDARTKARLSMFARALWKLRQKQNNFSLGGSGKVTLSPVLGDGEGGIPWSLGYPSCGQTDTLETLPSWILRMRG